MIRFGQLFLALSLFLNSLAAVPSRAANSCQHVFAFDQLPTARFPEFRRGVRGLVSQTGDAPVNEGIAFTWVRLVAKMALIGQRDSRLADRGLIIPNGGLCGSTCGVNILHALFEYAGKLTREFTSRPDNYIQRIVDETWNHFRSNARVDIKMDQLATVLPLVMKELTGRAQDLDLQWWRVGHDAYFLKEDSFLPAPDRLSLALVTVGQGNHFVVILGIDTVKKEITYADPNFPDAIFTTNYVLTTFDGVATINFAWNGQFGPVQNGTVRALMHLWLNENSKDGMLFAPRPPSPFRLLSH